MKKEDRYSSEILLLLYILLSIALNSCTYVDVITPENELLENLEEIDTINTKIHLDKEP